MKASTLKHMKNITAIILVLIVLVIGFLLGRNYDKDTTITAEETTGPTKHQRRISLRYCRAYVENFDQYCLHRSGTYEFTSNVYIIEPDGYLYVREFCPEMYLEYIAPVKHVWDSLKLIKMDWKTYNIKNKIKVKVKDSKYVYINTNEKEAD